MYETSRALGLSCVVHPILKFESYDNDLDDHRDITKIGECFEGLKTFDYDKEDGYETLEEVLKNAFKGERLDERKVTWLNEPTHSEPALAHGTVIVPSTRL